MALQNEKCVLVLDEHLPLGLVVNTAAILGITIGKEHPQMVGASVRDQTGSTHMGITTLPIPILKSSAEGIKGLREKLFEPEFQGLTVVDFSDLAQGCGSYDDFTEKMAESPEERLTYLGVAICGPRKAVNRLTGSLPLLR
ncbi:MAG: DUF2000 domain-containing protein [Clostridiales bacterium]|nr:DUF2000 domain-containing protein [Clostridiales bacterium]MDY4173325.1 DUF2000 domain-containing protein [Evtepia sp.]